MMLVTLEVCSIVNRICQSVLQIRSGLITVVDDTIESWFDAGFWW